MASDTSAPAEFLELLQAALERRPDDQEPSLQDVIQDLSTYRKKSDTNTLEKAFEAFGTAVGRQKSWQIPFRDYGILSQALMALDSDDTTPALRKQYFRVIGNSVADNDTNREVVTVELQKLVAWLDSEDLTTIVLIVLFNLCNDFDPAKAAAAALRLDATIAEKLFLDKLPEPALDYAVDLMTWATDKLTAEQLKDTASLKAFADLLKVALQYDEDHYHEYVAILVHYLQDPEFQQKVATPELLDNLVVLMLDFETRITPEETQSAFQELAVTKTDDRSPSDETSVLLLTQLINSISSISSTDSFAQNFNVRSPVIERLRAKLNESTTVYTPSTICACVILGNLAMSDQVCIDMVSIMQLHEPLTMILLFDKHSALLYAVAGFLRHLAFPEANRTILGDARLIEACHAVIARSEDAAVQGEIGALLGKLVTNNPDNIEKVVVHRAGERRGESGEQGSSTLEDIVKKALGPPAPLPSTSMKNPMIEYGRIIIATLRYIGRPNASGDVEVFQRELVAVPRIAQPIAGLVRQRFYADARSEGLLGLGLLAQSAAGASCVIEELKRDAGLLQAIKEFAAGKDGGAEQQGSAAGRDYQNAMVLLQALQNNIGEGADEFLKDQIVSLQEHLGKLMV